MATPMPYSPPPPLHPPNQTNQPTRNPFLLQEKQIRALSPRIHGAAQRRRGRGGVGGPAGARGRSGADGGGVGVPDGCGSPQGDPACAARFTSSSLHLKHQIHSGSSSGHRSIGGTATSDGMKLQDLLQDPPQRRDEAAGSTGHGDPPQSSRHRRLSAEGSAPSPSSRPSSSICRS
ncbi:hapless 2-like [Triticum urartu]|uniref:hapless 2-like n=1 Tax=Triticum urartu TaxID=4572 RepID=UPI0020445805|nr:hapless 2-like [Triticum urartu]